MATFEVSGFSELNQALSRVSDVPEEIKREILTAMGEEALAAVREAGEAAGIRSADPEAKHVLDALSLSKVKFNDNGGSVLVTFKGSRKDAKHGKRTRQAAVAFYNEYGTKHQRARPFMRPGIERRRQQIYEAGEKIYHRWLKSSF